MKSISASIVIAAGLAALVVSAFIRHSDTQVFIGAVALLTTTVGGIAWMKTLNE